MGVPVHTSVAQEAAQGPAPQRQTNKLARYGWAAVQTWLSVPWPWNHSAQVKHAVQAFGEHSLLQQLPLQQSCTVAQLSPTGAHVGVQVPLVQVPEQHSNPVQVPPWGTQQAPPWHEYPVQHSDALVHVLRFVPHGVQMPLLQMSEQHSLARRQAAPSSLHELHLEL
jgi:hypothetical protein